MGTLEGNLRYPIIGKLKDRLNNTWYEVNIGERLGFVNELDCEIDSGIPVLTYHHLLKTKRTSASATPRPPPQTWRSATR